jgi:DNA helicase-2/ATP-dependent DNA helicase PcrA
VINTPRRGIGKATIDSLVKASQELDVPLWEILTDETSVKTLSGRSSKGVLSFVQMLQKWRSQLDTLPANQIVQGIMEDSGYMQDLKIKALKKPKTGCKTSVNFTMRCCNLKSKIQDDPSLIGFLSSASLSSDLDNLEEEVTRVSLMTLHSSKGLEFPVVFLVGLEQGLFPNFRSLEDPAALEEERRLCYVGITRAQERLFVSYARERRLYGNREPASPSLFLAELPRELMQSNVATAIPTRWTKPSAASSRSPSETTSLPDTHEDDWTVGDRVVHKAFGSGQVTHIFGAGNKICLAVKFAGMGQKIVDPKLTPLQRVE